MKRSAPLILFFVALLLGLGAWLYFKRGPQDTALRTRAVATRGLAEYLARNFPGKRALVVSNPFTQQKGAGGNMNAYEDAGLRGLREGFGNKIAIEAVEWPELKPGARENPRAFLSEPQTTTPLSYLVAPHSFDKLARQHPGCSLLVTLIGLPVELATAEIWQAGEPKLAMLLPDLRVVGDTAAVRTAVKQGKIVAFVLNKPGAPSEQESLSQDFAGEFERRFLLVTAENIDTVVQSWPGLF